jgi:hypothetical protein
MLLFTQIDPKQDRYDRREVAFQRNTVDFLCGFIRLYFGMGFEWVRKREGCEGREEGSMKRDEDRFMLILIIIMPDGSVEYVVKVGTEKQLESPSGALPDPRNGLKARNQVCVDF